MANLLDLRNKINSTKNTGQITKALEMVSASRQRKAQEFLLNSRFIRKGVSDLMTKIKYEISQDPSYTENLSLPPLFRRNKSDKILVVTIMSQKGLCGPMNSNLFFDILQLKKQTDKQVDFISVNKVAQKYLRNFKENVISFYSDIPELPDISIVYPLIDYVKVKFPEYESVYLAFTGFIKTGKFKSKIIKLMPIDKSELESENEKNNPYSIEPDPYYVLDQLSNLFVDLEIYEAVLATQAAEHGARMIAMQKATDNAKELVRTLTLSLNKERQAKVTQSMAEISSNL